MALPNFWKPAELSAPALSRWWGKSWLARLSSVVLPLLIFAAIAWRVWGLEGGFSWEVAILEAIHATARPALTKFAVVFTRFGSAWQLLPITIAFAGLLAFRQQWRSLLYLVITLVGCGWINLYGKMFWHRVRPHLWDSAYPPLVDFSFPSGHAMSSMVTVATLLVLSWHTRWRGVVLALGSVYVVGIGWTRLYLGVHYPSDVLAGWMIAIAWAMGTNFLIKPTPSSPTDPLDQTTLFEENANLE